MSTYQSWWYWYHSASRYILLGRIGCPVCIVISCATQREAVVQSIAGGIGVLILQSFVFLHSIADRILSLSLSLSLPLPLYSIFNHGWLLQQRRGNASGTRSSGKCTLLCHGGWSTAEMSPDKVYSFYLSFYESSYEWFYESLYSDSTYSYSSFYSSYWY